MTPEQIQQSIDNIQANIQVAQSKGQTTRLETLQHNLAERQQQLSALQQPTQQAQQPTQQVQQVQQVQQPTQQVQQPTQQVQQPTQQPAQQPAQQQWDYKDDSTARANQIVSNLNEAKTNNPASLSSYAVFQQNYDYNKRTQEQKNILDTWYKGYDEGRTLAQQTARTTAEQYNAGTITQAQLDALKAYDANKYNATMQFINQQATLSEYSNVLNPKTQTNPFQPIIDATMNGLSTASKAPQFYEEYKNQINSQEMKDAMTAINEMNKQIEELDLDMNNAKKTLEKKYEGTSISRGALNAIINDELFELNNARSNLAVQMNSKVNQYNSQMQSVQKDMELRLQDYNMQQQAEQAQMQKIGFTMNLMNYRTPEQQMDMEFEAMVRKQEYIDGNIYSNDPATRKRAISNAVDRVLEEFAGIPMIRSREQMIQDIQNLVDNGMGLGEAITKNIREPIQTKPEYKSWLRQKFPPEQYEMGGTVFERDSNGNLTALNFPMQDATPQQVQGTGMSGQGLRNNNPGNIKDTQFGNVIGVGKNNMAQFATPEDGFDALVEKIKYNQTNSNSKYYGKTILEYFKIYAPSSDGNNPNAYANSVAKGLGVSVNTKIADVNALELAKLIAKHDSGYNYSSYDASRKTQGVVGGTGGITGTSGQKNTAIGYSPEQIAMFEDYVSKGDKALGASKDVINANLAEMGYTSVAQFKADQKARRATLQPDVKTLQLLEKLDSLEKGVKKYGPRSMEVWGPDLNADYNYVKNNLTLESLQVAKAKGATFGAMSDEEWSILSQSASALSPRISGTKFQKEIQNIREQVYANYPALKQGTTQTTQTISRPLNPYLGVQNASRPTNLYLQEGDEKYFNY